MNDSGLSLPITIGLRSDQITVIRIGHSPTSARSVTSQLSVVWQVVITECSCVERSELNIVSSYLC